MLSIRGLNVSLETARTGSMTVLDGLSLAINRGETVGIVGESGSGKSMLALATIGLLPDIARATGSIRFEGQELLGLAERDLSAIRGARIGMIFQEPMTALNPAMTVGRQIGETMTLHRAMPPQAAKAEALRLMDMVRIGEAPQRISAYPHELSGGERQRVGIAMAIALKPALIIADEPTTALDVTVQAEVLDILDTLVAELNAGLMLISHDIGVIARMADRVVVMHDGRMMEEGQTECVLRTPQNSYTQMLLAALPGRVRSGFQEGATS